jgi:hypothetical protein
MSKKHDRQPETVWLKAAAARTRSRSCVYGSSQFRYTSAFGDEHGSTSTERDVSIEAADGCSIFT